MNILFINLIISIILTISIWGQTADESLTTERIRLYLNQIEEVGFSGSVLVEIEGKKVLSEGYGFRNIELKEKNTPSTIFDTGSITKQFTATAIMKLVTDGRLSTSDNLSMYFENVPDDKKNITIHDLLKHQSGLQSNVGRDYEKITQEEFIDKVLNSRLISEPGTDFNYSNIGYSLLAMIIEKVSGSDYETYLYNNLFQPAQMEFTGYTRPHFDSNKVAVTYYMDDRFWGKPTEKEWDTTAPYWHLTGNGGILSTTEDLYKWHKALLSEQILTAEAKEKFYHPQLRSEEDEKIYYAYGWEVSVTDRNTRQVWHNGSNNIFYADFLRYIDENTAIIMLSNKFHPNFLSVNREISKIIFNPDYVPAIPVADNKINRSFTNNILETIINSGIEEAKQKYINKGQEEELLEFEMRKQGFNQLDDNNPEIAIQIFEMNVFAFPDNAKALQGLGEAYMETGNNELAIKYFKKSIAINPDNPFVNDMLKQLEN